MEKPKVLRDKIKEQQLLKNIGFDIVTKDYALSYILAGIASHPNLSESLIFKGGTALKKIFFDDYRFSEDLDFSVKNAPKGKDLEKCLLESFALPKDLLKSYSVDIQLERYSEKQPHPNDQEAFIVLIKFPWHNAEKSRLFCRIKLEITHDELVLLPIEKRPIFHGYGEDFNYMINCYHIEEIISEKLRALLQTHQKLVTRGWNKPRARDYYDLWCILKRFGKNINATRLVETLDKKCAHRGVAYETIDDFFTPVLVKEAHQHWQPTLGTMIQNLPACDNLLNDTKRLIYNIIFYGHSTTI